MRIAQTLDLQCGCAETACSHRTEAEPWLARAQAGVWQRWRLVNAAPSRFLDLTITMIDDDTPTGCQIALLAKDGVFLLDMPRLVNHAMLVGAARCAATCRRPMHIMS